MNISVFVVLGTLDKLGTASGYDIIQDLNKKMISKWTDVKKGSIYHALKQLSKSEYIVEVSQIKNGSFPTRTMYAIKDKGRERFDRLQEEAFMGLYPSFHGFKLGLKFNIRKSADEVKAYAAQAIAKIDNGLKTMEQYLNTFPMDHPQRQFDDFFIEHERMMLQQEKKWIKKAAEGYKNLSHGL